MKGYELFSHWVSRYNTFSMCQALNNISPPRLIFSFLFIYHSIHYPKNLPQNDETQTKQNHGFLGILRECTKVISKNGKLIATITAISILQDSLFYFTVRFATTTLLSLLSFKPINIVDSFEHIKKDVEIIIGFEFLYLPPFLAISLFSLIIIILVSVVAYSVRNLSFADFLSRIPKLGLITSVTSFHLKLFAACQIFLFLFLWIVLSIGGIGQPLDLIPIITLSSFALNFNMCVYFVFEIALLSVIKKSCYELQAFGKAEVPVKGKRLLGLIVGTVVMVIIRITFEVRLNQETVSPEIVCVFFPMVSQFLVNMVCLLSFAVVVSGTTKHMVSEVVELQESSEYSETQGQVCV